MQVACPPPPPPLPPPLISSLFPLMSAHFYQYHILSPQLSSIFLFQPKIGGFSSTSALWLLWLHPEAQGGAEGTQTEKWMQRKLRQCTVEGLLYWNKKSAGEGWEKKHIWHGEEGDTSEEQFDVWWFRERFHFGMYRYFYLIVLSSCRSHTSQLIFLLTALSHWTIRVHLAPLAHFH